MKSAFKKVILKNQWILSNSTLVMLIKKFLSLFFIAIIQTGEKAHNYNFTLKYYLYSKCLTPL